MKKQETFLPIFSGFYGTYFEFDSSDFEYENDCKYDDLEIDYTQYQNDVAELCCEYIQNESDNIIKNITFQNVQSPKFYNFSNDSINVIMEFDEVRLLEYIKEHIKKFAKYIKDNYTSYDGFLSRYTNDHTDWLDRYDLLGEHEIGALFQFYFKNEGIDEFGMYEFVADHFYIGEYITILHTPVEDLDSYDLQVVFEKYVNDIPVFGYYEVLRNECQKQADKLGMNWIDYLFEKENDSIIVDFLKGAGIEKVDSKLNKVE